jgi:hypothetical protein
MLEFLHLEEIRAEGMERSADSDLCMVVAWCMYRVRMAGIRPSSTMALILQIDMYKVQTHLR